MTTRTEEVIRSDLAKASVEYEAAVQAEGQAKANAVIGFRKELSAALSDGAVPCPDCSWVEKADDGEQAHPVLPIGMLKTPATERTPPIYEVGCLSCNRHERASSPKEAVKQWNAQME